MPLLLLFFNWSCVRHTMWPIRTIHVSDLFTEYWYLWWSIMIKNYINYVSAVFMSACYYSRPIIFMIFSWIIQNIPNIVFSSMPHVGTIIIICAFYPFRFPISITLNHHHHLNCFIIDAPIIQPKSYRPSVTPHLISPSPIPIHIAHQDKQAQLHCTIPKQHKNAGVKTVYNIPKWNVTS